MRHNDIRQDQAQLAQTPPGFSTISLRLLADVVLKDGNGYVRIRGIGDQGRQIAQFLRNGGKLVFDLQLTYADDEKK